MMKGHEKPGIDLRVSSNNIYGMIVCSMSINKSYKFKCIENSLQIETIQEIHSELARWHR